MKSPKTAKNKWDIIVPIILVVLIVFILACVSWFFGYIKGESDSAMYITELNGSAAPQGSVVSLTAEDFQVYTKLAPIFRDKTQKPDAIYEDGTHLYVIPLTMEERHIYNPLMGSTLEFEGKYYSFDLQIH